MKIVRVKGQPFRFLYEDVQMSFKLDAGEFLRITLPYGELFGRLRTSLKTFAVKRVFYSECNNEKRLLPFPRSIVGPDSFLPKNVAGDVLLRAEDLMVEKVFLKFALEGDRVIPINEWLALAKERNDRVNELLAERGPFAELDELNELMETCHLNGF